MRIEDLTQSELKKRLAFKCKHKHTGVGHPQCYEDRNGITERVGVLDIETNDFKADYGYILSYCILDSKTGKMYSRAIKPSEIRSLTFDKALMQQFCKDVRNFDRLVVYWGSNKRFDIPFLRTRAEEHGVDFPGYKEIWVTDVYDVVKMKLKLRNNRLQSVCEHLGIESKGHFLKARIWQRALAGCQTSLNYVLAHNKEDVISTNKVFKRLAKYTRLTKSSI